MHSPTIFTDRLILRKFERSDIDAVLKIFGNESVNVFLPWFPLRNLSEAEEFFATRYQEKYKNPFGYNYAICFKTDNEPIGYVNVTCDDSHDLGYGILPEYQHKGIVTEACLAVIERLRQDNFKYVTATHDINNPKSGNVMKRTGMTYKYSYIEMWQPKNKEVTFRMYQLNLDGNNDRIYKKYWDIAQIKFVENNV